MIKIHVGYDPNQEEAYSICVDSIYQHSDNAEVSKLYSKNIPSYKRKFDEPKSTDFTFTRFLVPYLDDYQGVSIFCDCDFLFLHDVKELVEYVKCDPSKAVWVVKHPQYIPNSNTKMDDKPQHSMYRKNWASLMVFNNSHPAIKKLTPNFVNRARPGSMLHQFSWMSDDEIGSLPMEWNCLDEYYHLENPKAIHYTDGGPWFPEKDDTRYSRLWTDARDNATSMGYTSVPVFQGWFSSALQRLLAPFRGSD